MFGEARLAVEAGEVHVGAQMREEEFAQRHRVLQALLETGLAFLANE
jgi:hypothetical protein